MTLNIKKYLIPLLALLFFINCSSKKSESSDNINQNNEAQLIAIELSSFGLIDEIMGCSCYLSDSQDSFQKGEFLFAEKYGLPDGSSVGYVQVDGQIKKMITNDIANKEGKRIVSYVDGEYRLIVEMEYAPGADQELLKTTAKLSFENPNGKVEKNLVGVCGC